MSPRRGRMPRPIGVTEPSPAVRADSTRHAARVFSQDELIVEPRRVPTEVAPNRPPAARAEPQAITPLPETDIGVAGDRAKAVLTPGEAVFGILSWLSSRQVSIPVGADQDPADLAALADEFCLANGISRPRGRTWPKKVVIPGAAEREVVRPTPPPEPERIKESPDDRQARMTKIREGLRARGPVHHDKPAERFSTFDPQEEQDMSGKTGADRVAELGLGSLSASPPLGYSGGGPPVPFDAPG